MLLYFPYCIFPVIVYDCIFLLLKDFITYICWQLALFPTILSLATMYATYVIIYIPRFKKRFNNMDYDDIARHLKSNLETGLCRCSPVVYT